jgi:hypothetical protein
MEEEFRPVVGFEEYFAVSESAIVKVISSNKRRSIGRILVPKLMNGYYRVGFGRNGKWVSQALHRVVASAWVQNPNNKPFVNHLDGDKLNCHAKNLEWVTIQENAIHAIKIGLTPSQKGINNPGSLLNESQVLEVFNSTLNQKLIGKLYNIEQATISNIKTGKTWSHLTGKIYKRRILTEDKVLEIYHSPLSEKELAILFSIRIINVRSIKLGRTNTKITGAKRAY